MCETYFLQTFVQQKYVETCMKYVTHWQICETCLQLFATAWKYAKIYETQQKSTYHNMQRNRISAKSANDLRTYIKQRVLTGPIGPT